MKLTLTIEQKAQLLGLVKIGSTWYQGATGDKYALIEDHFRRMGPTLFSNGESECLVDPYNENPIKENPTPFLIIEEAGEFPLKVRETFQKFAQREGKMSCWQLPITKSVFLMEDYAESLSQDRVGKWFKFDHLKDGWPREVSRKFHNLACELMVIEPCTERTVALRKLLEAKDAAVRAAIEEEENKITQGWIE